MTTRLLLNGWYLVLQLLLMVGWYFRCLDVILRLMITWVPVRLLLKLMYRKLVLARNTCLVLILELTIFPVWNALSLCLYGQEVRQTAMLWVLYRVRCWYVAIPKLWGYLMYRLIRVNILSHSICV